MACSLFAGLIGGAAHAADAKAESGVQFCVFDPIGSGETHRAMQDYALAMLKKGHTIQIKVYVDERVAVEDFRTGQCDGVLATGLRTRTPTPVARERTDLWFRARR